MIYRLPPRLRMLIESLGWTAAGYLSVSGIYAMLKGYVSAPEWWTLLAWLFGASLGAYIRKIPFHIKATDRSTLDLRTMDR